MFRTHASAFLDERGCVEPVQGCNVRLDAIMAVLRSLVIAPPCYYPASSAFSLIHQTSALFLIATCVSRYHLPPWPS
jgi:hypothetical protein